MSVLKRVMYFFVFTFSFNFFYLSQILHEFDAIWPNPRRVETQI